MGSKYTPCGGCGATYPIERCIGCFHPFMPSNEQGELSEEVILLLSGDAVAATHKAALETDAERIAYENGYYHCSKEYANKLHHGKQMLFRLASLVNADQKPDEKFLTEIKTFLDEK
jgi:hypothetical protein